MIWQLIAALCSGTFAGAAIYISAVEHPARLDRKPLELLGDELIAEPVRRMAAVRDCQTGPVLAIVALHFRYHAYAPVFPRL